MYVIVQVQVTQLHIDEMNSYRHIGNAVRAPIENMDNVGMTGFLKEFIVRMKFGFDVHRISSEITGHNHLSCKMLFFSLQ